MSCSPGGARVRQLVLVALLGAASVAAAQPDPLPSWNDGAAKTRIMGFVRAVTDSSAPTFVAPAERVAVFDNDGTLWSEQPLSFQIEFMLEQVKAHAPKHAEWRQDPVYEALVAGDFQALARMGHKPIMQMLAVANSGMTVEEYDRTIRAWLAIARHPRFRRLYTDLVFQPMREVLDYFRANGFKTYIVSGGGIEFMRPWTEKAYGVPPEQIVGSVSEVKFAMDGDGAELTRLTKIDFVDDGAGKPVGIYRSIGRRPIAAFGNSDGDLEMLRYTVGDAPPGARLALIVHHTDAEREWAYDRHSHVGKLDKALDEAVAKGWVVVDMKRDWKRVYSFE